MSNQLTLGAAGFLWDEFRADAPVSSERWATTDRGWVHLANHPDAGNDYGSTCVGNYVTYPVSEGPNGEHIHAVAYLMVLDPLTGMQHNHRIQCQNWHSTIDAAKTAIMNAVDAYISGQVFAA